MQGETLKHKKLIVGAVPIIDMVTTELALRELLTKFLRNERYAKAIIILMKNMLIEPAALYRIPKWASQFAPECIEDGTLKDDVIGSW